MRFLNRQLLRSIIAAGLAVVGASHGLASPGKMTAQWKEFCFVSDSDVSAQARNWQIGAVTPACFLGLNAGKLQSEELAAEQLISADDTQEIRECLIASNPVLHFVAHEDLNSRLCSVWIHGLRTSSHFVSNWIQERQKLTNELQLKTAKLIKNLNFVVDSAPASSQLVADEDYYYSGNIFIFSLETQSSTAELSLADGTELHQYVYPDVEADIAESVAKELSSDPQDFIVPTGSVLVATTLQAQDACPSEAYSPSGNRPPCLEGDLAWDTSLVPSKLTDDPHGMGHCRIPDVTADTQEISSEMSTVMSSAQRLPESQVSQTEASPSDSPSPNMAGLYGRRLVEGWIDPNWEIHHWIYSASDVLGSTSFYQPGDWTEPMLNRWMDTAYTSLSASNRFKPAQEMEPVLASEVEYVDLLGDTPKAVHLDKSAPEPITAPVSMELVSEIDLAEEVSKCFEEAFAASQAVNANVSKLVRIDSSDSASENQAAVDNLDESSRLATKLLALRLKQLGEILIQSADRLNQASDAIDIAGRLGTQR